MEHHARLVQVLVKLTGTEQQVHLQLYTVGIIPGRPVGGSGSPSLLEDHPDVLVGAQGRGSLYFQVFRYWLSSLDEVQMSPTR